MRRGPATGRRAARRVAGTAAVGIVGALALVGCSRTTGDPLTTTTPSASVTTVSESPSPSASPTGTASPGTASPATASPATASPGTASPGTASPGSASPSASSSGVQVTCTSVTVTGIGRTTVGPLRTTDIATVVSDGRNLTPGTRQQTDFSSPVLTAPGGGTISDVGTVQQVANLLVGQKHRVLTSRPPAPDENLDPTKRPFNSPGTYAVYNASSLVTTEAVVQCAGQQQTWTFTAEGDPASGQVNCAVEPARSNGLARSVFAQSC